jgi:hypothetical protein
MNINLDQLERRSLRLAIQLTLDDDDTRDKLYDWQIANLKTAQTKLEQDIQAE